MAGSTLPRLTVGLVRGLHGLNGAVRVEVLTDDADRFAVGATLFADGRERPLTVTWVGPTGPGLLVRFAELTTREAAEALRDKYLEAVAEAPLPEGSYYWHEIVGAEVVTLSGEVLGRVEDVFRAGEGEVYIVRGGPLGEVLVPAVRSVVQSLDPAAGRIVVDPVALALPEKPPRRRRRHERPQAEEAG